MVVAKWSKLWCILWVVVVVVVVQGRRCMASEGSVDIMNETSAQLLVHCKSGDDDLGKVYLQQHGDFYFHFGQNIFGTTFFYCSFSWQGFSQLVAVWKGKAYVDRLDCQVAGQCVWKVTERGFSWAVKGPLQPFYYYADWVRSPPGSSSLFSPSLHF